MEKKKEKKKRENKRLLFRIFSESCVVQWHTTSALWGTTLFRIAQNTRTVKTQTNNTTSTHSSSLWSNSLSLAPSAVLVDLLLAPTQRLTLDDSLS